MFQNILVPTDGTTSSDHAVRAAAEVAERFGAKLTLLHALPKYRSPYFPEVGLAWPTEDQYLTESGTRCSIDRTFCTERKLSLKTEKERDV
jgi:nucleotide-binding universal stress UspA family protein